MIRFLLRVLLALVVTSLLACKAEQTPTEISVVVDSDMRIGVDLQALRVEVFDRELVPGVMPLQSNEFAVVAPSTTSPPQNGQFTLPLSFVLAPIDPKSTRDFRLVITGLDAVGNAVVEQQVISSFRPAYSARLDVFLAQLCIKQLCLDANGQRSAETCDAETGKCELTRIASAEKSGDGVLAGYERPDAASSADSSAPPTSNDDAGPAAEPDATTPFVDAGSDAAVVVTNLPDAGIPPTQTVDPNNKLLGVLGTRAVAAASPTGRGIVVWQQPVSAAQSTVTDAWAALYEPDTGWGAPINLSTTRGDATNDWFPNAVMDVHGNATVMFLRSNGDMVARRNLAASRSWDTEAHVRIGDCNTKANLATDPAGNVTAVFILDSADLNTVRYEVATSAWNTLVGNVNTLATRSNDLPVLSADAKGNVTALWGATAYAWANHFDVAANRWGTATAVRSSTAAGFGASRMHIASAASGLTLMLWFETDDMAGYEVGGNAWDPALGTYRSTKVDEPRLRLSDGTPSALAADPLGGFVALWSDQAYTFDADANTFSAGVPVGRAGSLNVVSNFDSSLGIDANGTRVAVWAQHTPTGADVAWSTARRTDASWTDVSLAGTSLGSHDQMDSDDDYPSMSIGSPGTALVAWTAAATTNGVTTFSTYARWITYPTTP